METVNGRVVEVDSPAKHREGHKYVCFQKSYLQLKLRARTGPLGERVGGECEPLR